MEYLVERMSYTKSLKDFQLEDMREMRERLDLDQDLSWGVEISNFDRFNTRVGKCKLHVVYKCRSLEP